MRRQLGWPSLILAMMASAAIGRASMAAETARPTKVEVGNTAAYAILGSLPMMHEGRIKPLDTVAREEIKSIYTRETIKLTSEDGKTVTSWSPVAAFFDWSVRPKFWDEQPIISVEYLPIKRFILAEETKAALEAVAGKAATSEVDRARLRAVIALPEIDAQAIRSAIRESKLDEADARSLEKVAARIGEETKWLSPEDLENAEVMSDGKKIPFVELARESDHASPKSRFDERRSAQALGTGAEGLRRRRQARPLPGDPRQGIDGDGPAPGRCLGPITSRC